MESLARALRERVLLDMFAFITHKAVARLDIFPFACKYKATRIKSSHVIAAFCGSAAVCLGDFGIAADFS